MKEQMKTIAIIALSFLIFITGNAQNDTIRPVFSGGEENLYSFLYRYLRMPEEIRKKNYFEGIMFVSFIVDKDGSLKDYKIVKSISPSCDTVAFELLDKMPNWKPGTINGKPTSMIYYLPLKFSVNPRSSAHQEGYVRSRNAMPPKKAPPPNQADQESEDLIKSGDFEKALKRLKELYRGEPTNHNYHLQMAICKLKLGKTSSACKSFNKAKELGNEDAFQFIDKYCKSE